LCENALAVALRPRDFGDVAVRGHFSAFGAVFCLEALLIGVSAVLGGVCNSRRTHVGEDYALIAAISGLVPMMFMTRVIL
jgi:hypothetical protein